MNQDAVEDQDIVESKMVAGVREIRRGVTMSALGEDAV